MRSLTPCARRWGEGTGTVFSGIVLRTGLGQQKDKNAPLTEEQRRFPMSIEGGTILAPCARACRSFNPDTRNSKPNKDRPLQRAHKAALMNQLVSKLPGNNDWEGKNHRMGGFQHKRSSREGRTHSDGFASAASVVHDARGRGDADAADENYESESAPCRVFCPKLHDPGPLRPLRPLRWKPDQIRNRVDDTSSRFARVRVRVWFR